MGKQKFTNQDLDIGRYMGKVIKVNMKEKYK